jgi:hypothetical protein
VGIGVCRSKEERCGLSFESHALTKMYQLIHTIQARTLSGGDAHELKPQLSEFLVFFQRGDSCSQCGNPLERSKLATAGIDDVAEYNRKLNLNRILEAADKLQAMGVLPF